MQQVQPGLAQLAVRRCPARAVADREGAQLQVQAGERVGLRRGHQLPGALHDLLRGARRGGEVAHALGHPAVGQLQHVGDEPCLAAEVVDEHAVAGTDGGGERTQRQVQQPVREHVPQCRLGQLLAGVHPANVARASLRT